MQLAKLNGIKSFIVKHFEKLIFLNCIVAAIVLYLHDILYSLDGGGRYASGLDFLEVGIHGYNDHYFLGGVQNLFYPPLHDILLAVYLKLSQFIFNGSLNHRLIYSTFVFIIFSFFIYSVYKVSKHFASIAAKVFLLVFISWSLFINIYSQNMNLGSSLNFYKMPKTIFYQGLSFQDIFVTGLTNQFLSAGFLVLAILSLTKKNHIRTAFLISLSILSHFIFGLVIVLLCTVKMAFDRDFKNLLKIGIICFGLTAFFIVPLYIYKDFMITQVAMPFKTGFWLSMVAVLFLLFKSKNFSYHLSFSALLLVSFIGLAKILNKFNFPYPNFHYYRLLYPSLLLSLFAVAFFLNEAHAKWKKVMLTGIFSLAWFGNFGGHFYAADIFTAYIPEFESISPPSQSDFGKGRTYFFGIGRPVDFAAEINTRINEQRLFFVKGLYWESAQANKLISSVIYKLMGPPTVLEGMGEKTFETKSCEFFKCAFKSLMNITSVSEIWMPPKETLLKYFELGIPERKKFLSCYDDLLNSLEAPSGQLKFSAMIQNRYINRDTAIVKPVDRRNSETTIDAITERCEANPNDDGRIDEINLPSIHRNFSGNYVLNLPVHLAEYHVSLQYFPGLKYDTGKSKGLVPVQSKSGVIIQGSETVHLYYERTWIMWFAYVITALSVTSGLIALVVTSAKSSHSDK